RNAQRGKRVFHSSFGGSRQIVRFSLSLQNQINSSQRVCGCPLHHLVFFHSPAGLLEHRDKLFHKPASLRLSFRTREPDAPGWRTAGFQRFNECAAFLLAEGMERFWRMRVVPVGGHPETGNRQEYPEKQSSKTN